MTTYYTKNEKETIRLGKKLASKFFAGLVIVLNGDLGAGKTAITKGFAKGLGIKTAVTSPTFTIMNEYFSGKLPLYHFDMYRLEDSSEAYEFGMQDYFTESNNNDIKKGVVVVEWADKIVNLIPPNHININITKLEGNNRKIEVEESL